MNSTPFNKPNTVGQKLEAVHFRFQKCDLHLKKKKKRPFLIYNSINTDIFCKMIYYRYRNVSKGRTWPSVVQKRLVIILWKSSKVPRKDHILQPGSLVYWWAKPNFHSESRGIQTSRSLIKFCHHSWFLLGSLLRYCPHHHKPDFVESHLHKLGLWRRIIN